MENTTQLFLAVRFNCNKCHDHPFEKWTQDQYYSMAAYFAQVDARRGPEVQGAEARRHRGRRARSRSSRSSPTRRPARSSTSAPARPRRRSSRSRSRPSCRPRRAARVQAAKWITSPKNPYFAKSYVNRIWSYLLGVGIIEPVDDIRAGNPPTNPELLDRLTDGVRRERVRRAEADHDDLQEPHVPALASRRTSGTRTTRSTTRTRWPGGCRPRCCSTRSTRRPARRAGCPGCRRRRGGAAGRQQRRAARRVPRTVRQAGPRKLLRVRARRRPEPRADPGDGQRPDRRRRDQGPEQPASTSSCSRRRTTRRWSTRFTCRC